MKALANIGKTQGRRASARVNSVTKSSAIFSNQSLFAPATPKSKAILPFSSKGAAVQTPFMKSRTPPSTSSRNRTSSTTPEKLTNRIQPRAASVASTRESTPAHKNAGILTPAQLRELLHGGAYPHPRSAITTSQLHSSALTNGTLFPLSVASSRSRKPYVTACCSRLTISPFQAIQLPNPLAKPISKSLFYFLLILIPPVAKGPPAFAFACNSFNFLASSFCFSLNFRSSSSSSRVSFLGCLRGLALPAALPDIRKKQKK